VVAGRHDEGAELQFALIVAHVGISCSRRALCTTSMLYADYLYRVSRVIGCAFLVVIVVSCPKGGANDENQNPMANVRLPRERDLQRTVVTRIRRL
jgi:hypothetical protein